MMPRLSKFSLFLTALCLASLPMRAESAEVTLEEARSLVVSSPRPAYPFEVRKRHESGSGTAVVTIDPATGEVVKAEMRVSTRNEMLDNAALSAFSHWRFKPGTVTKVRIPIEFRLSGEVRIIEKARPMDEVLAPFLGRGDVIKAPVPHYPTSPPWARKKGSGVYEIHVDGSGAVTRVKILRSSKDEIFDQVVVKTLREWRLRHGPKVIELPLAFTLTPDSFNVRIP